MFGFKKKAAAAALSAAVLAAAIVPGLTPRALDTPPSGKDPFGMTAYVDELFEGKAHDWTQDGDTTQDALLGDYPWRAQYYDSNPEWDGFYTFKYMKTGSWSSQIDQYIFGLNWSNDLGQIVFEGGIPYFKTKHDEAQTLCLTFTAPKDGNYKIYPNSTLDVVRVMYPKHFPGGAETTDGSGNLYVPESSTLHLGFAIHKMAGDADMDTYDPAGDTKLWPTDKNYEYLTKDTLSFAFPTLENVSLKAGEKLRFLIDRTDTQGLDNWLVSAAMYPMVVCTDNTPPTAGNDEVSCTIGKAVSGKLKGADADEEAVLTYALKTDGTKGSAEVKADGSFTYTAGMGVEGSDSFVYTVTDEKGASAEGTVTVTFVDNKKPAAGKNAFTVMEGVTLTGDLEAADGDGDSVTVTLKTDAAHGELELRADGTFTYTPAVGYVGEDTFAATLSDGKSPVDVTVTLTVSKNEPPVADAKTVRAEKDTPAEIRLTASDVNETPLTFKLVSQPKSGTAVLEGDKVTYTPNAGFIGLDSFTFAANDGVQDSAAAAVSVAVLGEGLDALDTVKNAILECGGDVDKNKAFDFADYAYELPWKLQYRINNLTGDINDEASVKFETAIAATIMDWGGLGIADDSKYPSTTIQNAGFLGGMVHALNSGYLEDEKEAVAALTFVAPKDATWYVTGGKLTDKIGIWEGQAKENPIKVWVEVDGTMVWPADGRPLELSSARESATLPDLHIAMKAGAALRFCAQGTTKNGDHNNIYLDRAAYELGAYDKALDPVPDKPAEPEESADPSTPENPESSDRSDSSGDTASGEPVDAPETGVAFPAAAMLLSGGCGVLLTLSRRKKQGIR